MTVPRINNAIFCGEYKRCKQWFFGARKVVAAKMGTTVLGHYPEYVKLAESIRARRFQIPTIV